MPLASEPRAVEGVENEIELLRQLIESVAKDLGANSSLPNKLRVLEVVGHAAPQLARMLKAQRDLASGEIDPASLLRQAIAGLQEEWPELKTIYAEFKPQKEETVVKTA